MLAAVMNPTPQQQMHPSDMQLDGYICAILNVSGFYQHVCCRENEAEDPEQLTLNFSAAGANNTPHPGEQQRCNASSSHSRPPVVASSGKQRHSYFRARKLQRVCQSF